MIREASAVSTAATGKPRASGDDPATITGDGEVTA